MVDVEIVKYSADIFTSESSHQRMTVEIPGPVSVTTIEHSENRAKAVGIFISDDVSAWTVMSVFQETHGNIFSLKPTREGDLTLNGTIVPKGARVDIQEHDTIYMHYTDGEGGWR